MAGNAYPVQIASLPCRRAPSGGRGLRRGFAMNELLNILPWAFGLVAAAAAVNLSR